MRKILQISLVLSTALLSLTTIQAQQNDPGNWPQEIETAQGIVVIYQPQPDALENNILDARAAIALELNDTDTPRRITDKLAAALGPAWFRNPAFLAAKRPAQFNTEFVIQGYLTEERADTAQMLLTFRSIDRALVNMLNERNVRIIVLPGDSG